MAATFGAPLAAVVLAIELLLFEFSTRAFVPLVVATSVAGGVHALLFGDGPLFRVPAHDFVGLGHLPLFAVLGLACGLLAVVVTKGLFLVEAGFRRLPVDEFWYPVIGAVGFAIVGLGVPSALGVGYDRIGAVLDGRLAVGALVVLGLAKLIAWWIALGSGTSGGTLAPLLLIGGTFGALLGHLAGSVLPGLHLGPGVFALVAMAATFGAATRATFASIVFLFELTGDYRLILPLMLAAVLASLVAGALLDHGLMTETLTRRGVTAIGDYHADVLASTAVGDVMSTDVVVVPAGLSVDEARAVVGTTGHHAFPVVDEQRRCVAVVSRADLLEADADQAGAPVLEVAGIDVIAVAPTTPVLEALHLMLLESVDHLPVLDDDDGLVGICTRTDVLAARRRQLDAERPQPGWAPWLGRSRSLPSAS
jgi:CBS domain-containing protein